MAPTGVLEILQRHFAEVAAEARLVLVVEAPEKAFDAFCAAVDEATSTGAIDPSTTTILWKGEPIMAAKKKSPTKKAGKKKAPAKKAK